MSLLVLVLVASASALHVMWNTLVKTSRDKASFACLTSTVSSLMILVVLAVYWQIEPIAWPWAAVGWAALSGVFEAAYVILLFQAYFHADLSVVYPLSRGFAPLVTMLLGGELLGDRVAIHQAMAVFLVAAGVIGVGWPSVGWSPGGGRWKSFKPKGVLLAAATGCMIAGYHSVDRKAMTSTVPPGPLEYLFSMSFFQTVFVGLWTLLFLKKGRHLGAEWATNRRGVLLAGVFTPAAYLLIILALQLGNVTHVAAGRNIGIVISTLVGAFILKERVTGLRILGSVVIMTGVLLLALPG